MGSLPGEAAELPVEYLERVYAGVLGKIIGVYLGRPIELWSHQRIVSQLGEIRDYVHEETQNQLIVVDDDISGTFMFPIRCMDEHGAKCDISSRAIGLTWLNNIIANRSVFWWGGNGISTEQTAYLNLTRGVPAPLSGSEKTNGKIVSEQIGAQIFIDGFALLCPGNPSQAARLAGEAASVSHDGIAVHSAQFLAAMEAEAFLTSDIHHVIDTGLRFVPPDSIVAKVVHDVRDWARSDRDWYTTREHIEDKYGLDTWPGVCHVIPNLAVIMLALIYGGHSFHEAMMIVNTAGWDTDCNAGNLGCLVALMHGLKSFEYGPDWRGPVADQAYISAFDGGYAVNNAARIAIDIANLGRRMNGQPVLPPPKHGAQFHFSLPGSVQGFRLEGLNSTEGAGAILKQATDHVGRPGLALAFERLSSIDSLEVMTATFTPREVTESRTYELMASPLVVSGQTVSALVRFEQPTPSGGLHIAIRAKVYNSRDTLDTIDGVAISMAAGGEHVVELVVPDLDSQPVQKVGIVVSASVDIPQGTIWLDHLRIDGAPKLVLSSPKKGVVVDEHSSYQFGEQCTMWRHAWVRSVDKWNAEMPQPFCLAQDSGEGLISYGTREWKDYRVACARFVVHLGAGSGIIARVQGLRRFYALVFCANGRVSLVRVRDDVRDELDGTSFDWEIEKPYSLTIQVSGDTIAASIEDGPSLHAVDPTFANGGIGMLVRQGAASATQFSIGP